MTENIVELELGKLYLLSGLPGSGKSSWTKSLPPEMVISTDAMRDKLLGSRTIGGVQERYQKANGPVFSIVKQMVAVRLAERLTTFVDATLLADADRAEFVKLANEAGVDVEVLIFDPGLAVCKSRNGLRPAVVPDHVMERMEAKFERTSRFPYRLVPDGSAPYLKPRSLPTIAVDVVGDVHGLLDDLLELLERLGYDLSTGIPVHANGRKLLFLGDFVDRGQQSIETLQFVRRAVNAGHFAIAGNHERKLVQFWDSFQKGEPQARSFSSAETAMALMRMPKDERAPLVEFVRQLPPYYVYEDEREQYAFAHATLIHFDPKTTLYSECLYGSEGIREKEIKDVDAEYARNFEAGDNRYRLIRGHIPQVSAQNSVFSLEQEQAFGGHLVVLRFDEFVRATKEVSHQEAFAQCIVTKRCSFNFDEHSKKFALKRALDGLVKQKLATVQIDKSTGAGIYKYSKRVFFDALWHESPYLAKARGIVLDLAGNILVHPFDKVFNYGENGAGRDIEDGQQVIAVEKLNGFLGCISKHPFNNDLLVTTSGSFESPFVDYIRSFITPELRGRLLKFFSKNDVTLMFEVIHADDPHIIHYEPTQRGLWLIGARGKDEHAPLATEEQLDAIAEELELSRPEWYETLFGALKREVAESKLEGYMVRCPSTQLTLVKFKTPYYLVTKFLGRLSSNKTRHMYANPSRFKQTVDEEFYSLVDHLVANVPEVEFAAMTDSARVALVRDALTDIR